MTQRISLEVGVHGEPDDGKRVGRTVRPPLLAGLVGALLLAAPAVGSPRESPWSASLLVGPVVRVPDDAIDNPADGEFTTRIALSHKITGVWDAGLEAGYISFGHYYTSGVTDGVGPPRDGRTLNSIDLTLSSRWHTNVADLHPYLVAGGGAYAVYDYFPEANPFSLSRHVKPGIMVGAGVHGIIRPYMGFEFRWLTIHDGVGPGRERNKSVLNFMFGLTSE